MVFVFILVQGSAEEQPLRMEGEAMCLLHSFLCLRTKGHFSPFILKNLKNYEILFFFILTGLFT